MDVAWTKHLKDPQEKADFERYIQHSKPLLDHLKGLIKQMDTDLERSEMSPKSYDTPNWDYKQAHCNGYRQCLSIISRLLTLETNKETQ
jgi:hypothetical protein